MGLRPLAALDLSAMHDAARFLVKGIAPMHCRAIVPQQKVADPPLVLVAELGPVDVRPQCVENLSDSDGLNPSTYELRRRPR